MKLLKVFAVLLVMIILTLIISVNTLWINPSGDASANPNKCPPGAEKNNGCVWVQHRVTGDCMWMPGSTNAQAWQVVDEGTCPNLVPVVENTKIVVQSPTAMKIVPTSTKTAELATQISTTLTSCPSATSESKPLDPVKAPAVVSATGTPVCDICKAYQDQASAMMTLAANDTIRLGREK